SSQHENKAVEEEKIKNLFVQIDTLSPENDHEFQEHFIKIFDQYNSNLGNDNELKFPRKVMITSSMINNKNSPKNLAKRKEYYKNFILSLDRKNALDFIESTIKSE